MCLRSCVATGACVVALVLHQVPARAAPGDLDTAFGSGGVVMSHAVSGETSAAHAVVVQPDGRIVAVGGTQGARRERFALIRYRRDGRRDRTFRDDGTVATAFHAHSCVTANAVALQSDGKIVVAGIAGCRGRFALARYTANGYLDPTFGRDGRVTTRFRSGRRYSEAFGLAIEPDGDIVAAGVCCGGVFALARYRTNGRLDRTFSEDGRLTTDFTEGQDQALDVALQVDGRIVVAGVAARDSNHARFALARYTEQGRLDAEFGTDGKITTVPARCVSQANAVAVEPDGQIVAAGWAGCIDVLTVVRYGQHGKLDPAFGNGGVAQARFGCPQTGANAVGVQVDGSIVASGYVICKTTTNLVNHFGTARFEPDGELDRSFAGDGTVTTTFWDAECFQQANGVAVQTNGNIVVAGSTVCDPRHTEFSLARYLG
jgi:uncharacterized delta-60 repeat protein